MLKLSSNFNLTGGFFPEVNNQFINQMKKEGRKFIDIGPDFNRRLEGGASKIYESERELLKNYNNNIKVFKRTSKTSGGVLGLD